MTIATTAELRIADQMISRFGLDLDGLKVFTEAASGPYLCTPLLAALAGAERVYAVTADSRYAPRDEVQRATSETAMDWGVADRIEIAFSKPAAWLADADIVTNSGFVRPIDAPMISALKPTAVIPLMWETWEHRPDELDLDACRALGILVMGTCESEPPCDMRRYSGPLALKLLSELGIEPPGGRVVLLGGQPALGQAIAEALSAEGLEVSSFSSDADGARPYAELRDEIIANVRDYDAIVVAEYKDPTLLLGEGGLLEPLELAGAHPDLRIGVISGNVDAAGIRSSGLRYAPAELQPFGHMSYQPSQLGPEPVLELHSAGLKVGEAMSRARLRGEPPDRAALEALERSPAMDFSGPASWA